MDRIKELISKMTLEEKASLCSGADFIKKLKADSELWKVYSNNSLKASLNYTYKNAEQYVS